MRSDRVSGIEGAEQELNLRASMTTDDFVSFAKAMDNCWLERRLEDLSLYLADDIVVVAPNGTDRIEGFDAATESYRQFLMQAQVHRFATDGYIVTTRGDAAIVEYGWQMIWMANDTTHAGMGREVLVLAQRNSWWRVVWRTQISLA